MVCIKCKAEIPDGSRYCNMCGKKQVKETGMRKNRPHGAGTVYKVSGKRQKPWAAARYNKLIGYFRTQEEAFEALESTASQISSIVRQIDRYSPLYFTLWLNHLKKISRVNGSRPLRSYKITSTTLCKSAFLPAASAFSYSSKRVRISAACCSLS